MQTARPRVGSFPLSMKPHPTVLEAQLWKLHMIELNRDSSQESHIHGKCYFDEVHGGAVRRGFFFPE